MIEAKDITGARNLEKWLQFHIHSSIEARPEAIWDCSRLSARCALRVLPFAWDLAVKRVSFDVTMAPLRYGLLASIAVISAKEIFNNDLIGAVERKINLELRDLKGVHSRSPMYEYYLLDMFAVGLPKSIKNARASKSAATSVSRCINVFNAKSAEEHTSDHALAQTKRTRRSFVMDSVRAECRALERRGALAGVELWNADAKAMEGYWRNVKEWLSNPQHSLDPHGWSFWIDWYDRLLDGREMPLEMLKEIVLIHDEFWEAGPDVVNPIINEIRERYVLDQVYNAEHVEQNPESGKLNVIPDYLLPELRLSDIQAKMLEAAEAFDGAGGANGPYHALTAEVDLIRRAAGKTDSRPIGLYDACRRAAKRAQGKAARGDCPQDDLIEDFAEQLTETAFDIMGFDGDVKQVVSNRAALKLEERAQADPVLAAEVLPAAAAEVEAISEGDLQAEYVEDAQIASDPQADPEARGNALYRLASRTFRISKWVALAGAGSIAILSQVPGALQAIEVVVASPAYQAAMRYLLSFF